MERESEENGEGERREWRGRVMRMERVREV
jgi:hypothetical protein